jgi:tetratricopeptide (TPR) repeat protein
VLDLTVGNICFPTFIHRSQIGQLEKKIHLSQNSSMPENPSTHFCSLSLAMIARNEERVIARCLESVRGIAEEMVVVDTGSTDATREIAEQSGARVFEFTWCDDFSAARNKALEHARGRMVLFLDADEWIEPQSAAELARVAKEEFNAAHYLVTVNKYANGEEIRNSVVRLFPNLPGVRFIHRIHEDVIPSLLAVGIPIRNANIEIGHSGYLETDVVSRKSARNLAILEKSIAEGLDAETEPHARYNLGVAFFEKGELQKSLEQFEWCISNSGLESPIGRICSLRAADCHFRLGNFEKSLSLLPRAPEIGGHPGGFFLAARILHTQNPASAQRWLEAVLASPDAAYNPPVPLAKLKLGALAALGPIWLSNGRPDLAAKILALAKALKIDEKNSGPGSVWKDYIAAVKVTS